MLILNNEIRKDILSHFLLCIKAKKLDMISFVFFFDNGYFWAYND